MALEPCKDCGSQLSARAKQCPHCGAPIVKTGGCAKLFLVLTILITPFWLVNLVQENKATVSATPQTKAPEEKVIKNPPEINAELSKFGIDEGGFFFTLSLRNLTPYQKTVYAVVYGKNDSTTPPRRHIWPAVLNMKASRRGVVYAYEISNEWASRSEDLKGAKCVLKPYGADSLEGGLFLNKVCQNEAWRGQVYAEGSAFNELSLWVFSKTGQLIYEKKYLVGD